MDIWRRAPSFASVTTDISFEKGAAMFDEIAEELLDLSATVRGYGGALYAAVDDSGSSSSLCCSIVLCCCYLCW
jgi:hypothetical protein